MNGEPPTIARRELISALGGVLAWPLARRAQQPPMPMIGFLYFGWPDAKMVAAFHKGKAAGEQM